MNNKIKSDGLSSDYHKIRIPASEVLLSDEQFVTIENHSIIRHALGNDFDKGNILKALIRLGKKEGVSVRYDLNKIKWTIEKLIREDEEKDNSKLNKAHEKKEK